MRTSLSCLLVASGTGAIMAIGVLVAGLGLTTSEANRTDPAPGQRASVGPTCLDAPVSVPAGVGVAGRGQFCSSGRDIQATLSLYGLVEGKPYTAWLAYRRRLTPDVSQAGAAAESDTDVPETPLLQLGEGIASES